MHVAHAGDASFLRPSRDPSQKAHMGSRARARQRPQKQQPKKSSPQACGNSLYWRCPREETVYALSRRSEGIDPRIPHGWGCAEIDPRTRVQGLKPVSSVLPFFSKSKSTSQQDSLRAGTAATIRGQKST